MMADDCDKDSSLLDKSEDPCQDLTVQQQA